MTRSLQWNLIGIGGDPGGRTFDLVLDLRSWLIGVEVSRWKFLTASTHHERTTRVHLGPLHFTTWKSTGA